MKLEDVLTTIRDHQSELRSHGVGALWIFGSVARDQARIDSDVDVLVEFDRKTGLLGLAGLQLYLEEILGRPVDLVTPTGLRPEMRDRVLGEAVRAA